MTAAPPTPPTTPSRLVAAFAGPRSERPELRCLRVFYVTIGSALFMQCYVRRPASWGGCVMDLPLHVAVLVGVHELCMFMRKCE